MFKNDYIMNMIFQMGKFLLNLKRLIKEEKYKECLDDIDKVIKDLTGMEPSTFDGLDYQNVSNIIARQGTIDWAKCIFISEALREKGYIYELLNNEDESFYYYLKSLNFVLYLINNLDNFEIDKYLESIDFTYSKIREFVLPYETRKMLVEYLMLRGEYAEAEDIIYELIDEGNTDDNKIIVDIGINFYKKLMNVCEEDLIIGGLPKEEVIEGLNKLISRLD